MAGHAQLHAGPGNPQSFRPNIYPHASASHVSSNPSSNVQDKSDHKHKSRRHHHHHHHHHHHSSSSHERHDGHHSGRRHAKEVVQSAIQLQPPTSFGDLLKQARGSRDPTSNHSSKSSVSQVHVDGVAEGKEDDQTLSPRVPPRPEEVKLERKRVQVRERDLRVALQSLSDQSLKTSRRLDDTYYSILEKVSILQQTIGTLQELSSLTEELHENFESDAKDLVEDVRGQFDNFGNFDTQQQQIVGLEERIKSGQDKADALTQRLTKAKERVDARVKAESEWKSTSTRRLRYFWAVLFFISATILALILFPQFKTTHVTRDPDMILDFVSGTRTAKAPIRDKTNNALTSATKSTCSIDASNKPAASPPEDDSRLHVFDEL